MTPQSNTPELQYKSELFNDTVRGALFSPDRKYRFFLKRTWNQRLPGIMFIGLNPSKADEHADDNTIKRVMSISHNLGYGTLYMMNCFPFVSTEPSELKDTGGLVYNDVWLIRNGAECKTVVFAWGTFKIVRDTGRDLAMMRLFPNAMALHINANGSPKHPLYCRADSQLVPFNKPSK